MDARDIPPPRDKINSGMAWVPGGTFTMGSDRHYPEEAPVARVQVDGFYIDPHPVTNEQFAAFIEATGHVTIAQLPPDPIDYPDVDPSALAPASAVFTPPMHPVGLHDAYQWWSNVPGADWRHPQGPSSDLTGLADHPVVHITWADAAAYAAWRGASIPTETEWEYAARGGTEGSEYAWGDQLVPGGRHMANVWQGDFPIANDLDDGYYGTSPAGAFPPNSYGLFDMIGNVWEWTADWWSMRTPTPVSTCCSVNNRLLDNPSGGSQAGSVDTNSSPHARIPRKVIKGGSYLCAPNYCQRYRPAARLPQTIDTSTCHLGFRCVIQPHRD